MTRCLLLSALGCAAPSSVLADSEASNVPHIATDDYGRCFVHSVPDEYYGTAGRTDVYAVGTGYPPDGDLSVIHSYDWFAQQIYVACNVSDGKRTNAPAVVQIGPWPRGHAPNEKTLAIAFHYNGETLAEYSTLDIADGDPANASCSVSHYTVIQKIDGFSGLYGEAARFTITTVDGRRMSFDVTSGELVDSEDMGAVEPRGMCPDLG